MVCSVVFSILAVIKCFALYDVLTMLVPVYLCIYNRDKYIIFLLFYTVFK